MSTSLVKEHKNGARKKVKNLTIKELDFVQRMLADLNMEPTSAARAAGYKQPSVIANRLMKKPLIQRMLGNAVRERSERTKIEADEVLEILHRALTLDPLDLFESRDGALTVRDLESIPQEIRCLITGIKCKTWTSDDGSSETTVEIKWVSKELALNLCMKHLGLLEEKLKVDHNINHNMVLQLRNAVAARGRVIGDDTINGLVNQ